MKKSSFALILALGLALSPLCALDSSAKLGVDSKKAVQSSSLLSADADFLFASNASHLNVVALSDEEMRLTEGEGVILTTITTAYQGYRIYTKIKKWFR